MISYVRPASGGRHVFAALAEFERSATRERTAVGLKTARVEGWKGRRQRRPRTGAPTLYHYLSGGQDALAGEGGGR